MLSAHDNEKPLIVHLVEVKDWSLAARRKKALDGSETVLRVGSVLDDAVEVCNCQFSLLYLSCWTNVRRTLPQPAPRHLVRFEMVDVKRLCVVVGRGVHSGSRYKINNKQNYLVEMYVQSANKQTDRQTTVVT